MRNIILRRLLVLGKRLSLKWGEFGIKPNEAQADNKKLPLEAVNVIWSG
jgi:hypothetical protein